jgi:hypothetical protein
MLRCSELALEALVAVPGESGGYVPSSGDCCQKIRRVGGWNVSARGLEAVPLHNVWHV